MGLAERLTSTGKKSVEKKLDEFMELAGMMPDDDHSDFIYGKQELAEGIEARGKKAGNTYVALMEISLSSEESDSIEEIIKGQSWAEDAQVRNVLGTTGERTYVKGSFLLDFGGFNEAGKPIVTFAHRANRAFTIHSYINDLGTMRIKLPEIINQPAPAQEVQAEEHPVKYEQTQEPVQESQAKEAQPEAAQAEEPEEAEKPEHEKSLVDFLREHMQDISDTINAKGDSWEKFSTEIKIESDDKNFSIEVLGFEAPDGEKELGVLIGSKPEKYQKQLEDALKQEASKDSPAWKQGDGKRKYVLGYLTVEFKELDGVPQIQATSTLESFTKQDYAGIAETTIDFIIRELEKPEEIKVPEMPDIGEYKLGEKKYVPLGKYHEGVLATRAIGEKVMIRLVIKNTEPDRDVTEEFVGKFERDGYKARYRDDRGAVVRGLSEHNEMLARIDELVSYATEIIGILEESKAV